MSTFFRIQYGRQEIAASIPANVRWAGDAPVIIVDNLALPGVLGSAGRPAYAGFGRMKATGSESVPACLKPSANGVLLFVKVQPRARRNEIGGLVGNELKVKVTAPPVDSAANEALVRFLAEILGCSRGSIRLLHGQTSRHKVLEVQGVSLKELTLRLA